MLSAYVEVLLCVIELLAFVAFKNTTAGECNCFGASILEFQPRPQGLFTCSLSIVDQAI